jgi:hypothetical protein
MVRGSARGSARPPFHRRADVPADGRFTPGPPAAVRPRAGAPAGGRERIGVALSVRARGVRAPRGRGALSRIFSSLPNNFNLYLPQSRCGARRLAP